MANSIALTPKVIGRDLTAGLVVFLVALPLCLGIAQASNAPLFSGLLAGIIGGLIVGAISGSHTSVAGPAAGLTAVVITQLEILGSFEAFLLTVLLGGVLQICMGIARLGSIAAFFPSSVIKGLLAAIGVILILKQIPHLFGHDTDPEGEMAFQQPDNENTFSELLALLGDFHVAAMLIGLISLAILVLWDRWPPLKKTGIPGPLVVVLLGAGLSEAFRQMGDSWVIGIDHLVRVPVAGNTKEFMTFFTMPDWSAWTNLAMYKGAVTIALVASLETLLNLEAVDKLDPKQRTSPPNRELVAQGAGNVVGGLLGALPVTSVIVRSSVNVHMGANTKLSTLCHGALLLSFVAFFSEWLNKIPLSCLAAILIVTGFKLASPKLVKQMWQGGRYQFIPFITTVVAIVFTDLLVGILIGLIVAISFILNSNLRRPVRRVMEKHLGGDVLRIELANQVSFLKRASLDKILSEVPRGGHVLLDATATDYIDPDVLDLFRDFEQQTAPAHDVEVSFLGFRDKYPFRDKIQYVDYSTRELQEAITPKEVLQILKEGNERFSKGLRLNRDLARQVHATADGHHPLAVILSCIDSRAPAELIFDVGVGDIFSVRVAGNMVSRDVLGSIEYGAAIAGAKLVVVLGHTNCRAVSSAIEFGTSNSNEVIPGNCQYIEEMLQSFRDWIDLDRFRDVSLSDPQVREESVNEVATTHVLQTVRTITESERLAEMLKAGGLAVVGAMYNVATGEVNFLTSNGLSEEEMSSTVSSGISVVE